MGEGDLGRAWLLKSVYSKTPNTNTDVEGAVDSVRINTKKYLKLRVDSFAYSRIAVPFTH